MFICQALFHALPKCQSPKLNVRRVRRRQPRPCTALLAPEPQGQRRKRAKPAPAAPLYRTRDAETAPSVFAQPGGSMFSPAFAQGMMLAELNASRAREQSERESQARFLGFMGVPK